MPSLSRRGFLGLFAASAVVDPDSLLWVPGKRVVSIPASVRPPRVMQFGVSWEEKDSLNASAFHEKYLRIRDLVDRELAKSGKGAVFLPMELPKACVVYVLNRPLEGLPLVRHIAAYDVVNRAWQNRLDCLLKI
jgi:hypothetical protein